jgi:Fungal Zn(2)-Cys(6) binuclear cluster domain
VIFSKFDPLHCIALKRQGEDSGGAETRHEDRLLSHQAQATEARMPILRVSADDTELRRDVRPFTPPLSPFDRLALNYNMSEDQQDPIDSLTPEEANRIIHSHRKVRYGKPGCPAKSPNFISFPHQASQLHAAANCYKGTACWPCRQRKVKCDNKQPCLF